MFNFRIDPPPNVFSTKFERAYGKIGTNLSRAMRILGSVWLPIARAEAPKRSGRFAEAIRYDVKGSKDTATLTGYAPNPLARWIIEGTPPHPIPKVAGGKTLKFLWPRGPRSVNLGTYGDFTAYHFMKHVNHPGTKPNAFDARAATKIKPHAVQLMTWVAQQYKGNIKE